VNVTNLKEKQCRGNMSKYLSLFIVMILITFVSLVLAPTIGFSRELDGLEIMQQVYKRDVGNTITGTVEMILIGSDGNQRKRKMTTYTKRYDELTKRVFFFRAPADVRGVAFLTYDYPSIEQEDEQWIYLPALHKTKRISASKKSGSFMGSDFSYSDLTQKSLESNSYRLIKEQQLDQHPVWIIEAVPKNKKMIDLYGYSKSLLIVRKDNFVIIRAVHWLKNKNILKYNEVLELEKIGDIWIPTVVQAKTVNSGKTVHQTLLINTNIKLNASIDDELFTKRRLEQGL